MESKVGETACTLITDPFENEAAIRFPKTAAPDVLVLSHQSRNAFPLDAVQGTPFIIRDPGEYEVKGVFVNGIQDPKADEGTERSVMYRFTVEGMNVAFFGRMKRAPTEFEVEALQNIDILLLSVGGHDGMDAKTADEVVNTLEPRMVVPLNYAIPGIKTSLGSVDAFCKLLGANERQNVSRLKITKKDLPVDTLVVTVLERD
jgi:hypothetical protein